MTDKVEIPLDVLRKVNAALEIGRETFDDDSTCGHYKIFANAASILKPYLKEE